MDNHQRNSWNIEDNAKANADHAFDDLWTCDLNSIDFEAALADPDYGMPSVSDELIDLATLDHLTSSNNNVLSEYPTFAPSNEHAIDTLSLEQLSGNGAHPIMINTLNRGDSPLQSVALQRWQNSPPETEAASLSAITRAMEQRPSSAYLHGSRTSSFEALQSAQRPSTHRRPSRPSSTTSLESVVSDQSGHSSKSNASQSRRRRVTKPRNTARNKGKQTDAADRIYNCTFCCDAFKTKFDWSRHEKSLHVSMEEWICTPHGGSVVLPLTGRVHCAYCSALDPTPEHLEKHNYSACQGGQTTPRTFRRKDHLVQHLRLVHGLDTLPLIDDWKVDCPPITSRCGFCDASLSSWVERSDHLAAHFRAGCKMKDWKGDHGFDRDFESRLYYDYPPYLIAHQQTTLVPFSITNHESIQHTKEAFSRIQASFPGEDFAGNAYLNDDMIMPNMDTQPLPLSPGVEAQKIEESRPFSEILVSHLARFARQQVLQGVVPTDEMFQREARRVLDYDADDNWNQTVADDAEWMRSFRTKSGFTTL
ncbi:hypothetical protein DE146DRAFT_623265 [Phaeosphaeria sp. MPI-PUGE-AT-0046c]|nr:hypothetical protein DE146DRAFT_623265 [Phaeosphaeria sp. MPI-PUGE-AT-0046c]